MQHPTTQGVAPDSALGLSRDAPPSSRAHDSPSPPTHPLKVASAGLITLLACAAFVGVIGLTLHPRLLLLLPALLVVLLAGVLLPGLSLLFVRGHLRFAKDRIHENDEVTVALTLRQGAPWPAWGLVLEADAVNQIVLEPARPFVLLDRTFMLQPQHRGVFPRRTPRLQTGFPFGLVTASRRTTLDQPLVVWPRVFPVAAPPDWASADNAVGHVETRRAGATGDTLGVREYRHGDPMRWIHWPQTARHDRFMVREFQASGAPRIRIVLDCDEIAHVGRGSDSSFEWAVRIAASVAVGWLEQGAEVELVAGEVQLPAAGGRRHQGRVLDALAHAQRRGADASASPPESELTTVFISTDLGWANRPEPSCCAWRGFMLLNQGFGGNRAAEAVRGRKVVVVESPTDAPAALLRVKRGLADVA